MTTTSALARRLQRLLDQHARATAPRHAITRLHTFDVRRRRDDVEECQRPSWSARLTGEPDLSGFREVWHVSADSPAALDAAIASLTASGDVPAGEWERFDPLPPCPGGRDCTHLPQVVLDDGSVVSSAELRAMEGRA